MNKVELASMNNVELTILYLQIGLTCHRFLICYPFEIYTESLNIHHFPRPHGGNCLLQLSFVVAEEKKIHFIECCIVTVYYTILYTVGPVI